jgi:arylsulfatase A-like enzyme
VEFMKRFFITTLIIFCFCSFLHSTNVIIIAVDTLRADHLGCYDYPRNASPNIDKFAEDSIKFLNCYTPSPLTTPAFASMLSSLPPYKHGAKRNGMSVFDRIKILPQFLRRYSYYSGAFVSNWTLKKKLTGLNRGFDTYTEVLHKKRWFGIMNPEGKAPEVNKNVFKWLHRNSEREFFLWVHYTEPHAPYAYHKEFDFEYRKVVPSIYPTGSDFNKIRKYDTEIGYDDFHIGELIKRLKKLGLYRESLIVFMADHGESFGEHNYYRHGRKLYNSCLHVPLIVKLPGNKNANSEVKKNVSLLDIAPTILSVLGYPIPQELEGMNLFDSYSGERVLYFEAYRGAVHEEKGDIFHLKVEPIRYGLLKNNFKLIFDKGFEAYDISSDKFELKNIYKNPDKKMGAMTDMLKKFILKIQEFIKYSKKYLKQRSELSKEDIEKLRSLGYIKKQT